jgi:leader peptidase (prepilin peptidase)/N-methyltransferase
MTAFSAPEIAAAFAAGLIFGSFLNVVIHRGPRLWDLVDGDFRGGLASPRSYCPACRAPIPAHRMIPLVSFALLRGRCAACGAKISGRYPVVELLGGAVAVASILVFGMTAAALAAAVAGWALIALAFIDLETGYLPDAITLPLAAVGLAANAAGAFVPFSDAAIGAVAGYAMFRGVDVLYKAMRGREGLGQGDAKLLAAIGAWSGWMMLPVVVFAGALATLAAIGIARLRGRKTQMEQPIPFGPGLCAAGFLALLFAPRLLSGL